MTQKVLKRCAAVLPDCPLPSTEFQVPGSRFQCFHRAKMLSHLVTQTQQVYTPT